MQECAIAIKYDAQSPPTVVLGISLSFGVTAYMAALETFRFLDKGRKNVKVSDISAVSFLEVKSDDSFTLLITLSLASS